MKSQMKAGGARGQLEAGRTGSQGKAGGAYLLMLAALAAFAVWWLLQSMAEMTAGAAQAGRHQLEQAIWRAAVVCYTTEGRYPPDLQYLEDHYGIQIDESKYVVQYQAYAENLMPDITVLEAGDAE